MLFRSREFGADLKYSVITLLILWIIFSPYMAWTTLNDHQAQLNDQARAIYRLASAIQRLDKGDSGRSSVTLTEKDGRLTVTLSGKLLEGK